MMRLDKMRDAMSNDSRFTAPGACKQQKRTLDVRDSFALLRI